jgi:hypothetical protein
MASSGFLEDEEGVRPGKVANAKSAKTGWICLDIRAFFARMDVADLRLFADVARRRGFAAVAEERDVDPSSVSRAIAALEAELGLRLFHRTTRTMALTEAGDLYLNRVLPAVEELERRATKRRRCAPTRSAPLG